VVDATRHFQLKGKMPSGLGTDSTKTKLIVIGPGKIPGLFIFDEHNLGTANLSRTGKEQCCIRMFLFDTSWITTAPQFPASPLTGLPF
jgi:hypothetical protein